MNLFPKWFACICLLACGTFLTGCFYKNPVRHLASEIGLTVLNQTTQEEIVSLMGFPETKRSLSENEEEWIYFQESKSLLRRTPLLGSRMGRTDYDVAIIIFKDRVVTSSQYRSFTEEEFKQLGIANHAARE